MALVQFLIIQRVEEKWLGLWVDPTRLPVKRVTKYNCKDRELYCALIIKRLLIQWKDKFILPIIDCTYVFLHLCTLYILHLLNEWFVDMDCI